MNLDSSHLVPVERWRGPVVVNDIVYEKCLALVYPVLLLEVYNSIHQFWYHIRCHRGRLYWQRLSSGVEKAHEVVVRSYRFMSQVEGVIQRPCVF